MDKWLELRWHDSRFWLVETDGENVKKIAIVIDGYDLPKGESGRPINRILHVAGRIFKIEFFHDCIPAAAYEIHGG